MAYKYKCLLAKFLRWGMPAYNFASSINLVNFHVLNLFHEKNKHNCPISIIYTYMHTYTHVCIYTHVCKNTHMCENRPLKR